MFSPSLQRPFSARVPAKTLRRQVADWLARLRSRRALGRLDARLLADVGLDTTRATREARRLF